MAKIDKVMKTIIINKVMKGMLACSLPLFFFITIFGNNIRMFVILVVFSSVMIYGDSKIRIWINKHKKAGQAM
jgi:hypothetical protein